MGLIFTKGDLKEVREEVAKYKVNYFYHLLMFSFVIATIVWDSITISCPVIAVCILKLVFVIICVLKGNLRLVWVEEIQNLYTTWLQLNDCIVPLLSDGSMVPYYSV